MSEKKSTNGFFSLPDAPPLPGLAFRHYRGEEDLPAMIAVIDGERNEDGTEWIPRLEDTLRNYRHLVNCDPTRDALIAEIDGHVVGYSRVWWYQETDGRRLYPHFVHLLPEWRVLGLRHAMARWNERRLREIAAETSTESLAETPRVSETLGVCPRFFQAEARDTEVNWAELVAGMGYGPVRYGFEMVRPTLEAIPDVALPPGLETRPVRPEQFRAIWEGMGEAFRDHWGYSEDEWGETGFDGYADWGKDHSSLWQIAWCGDQVVGAVHAEINAEENEAFHRKRGYTEAIFVRRPWRRQGVAKALIASSLRVLKEQGMEEACHGVDADNPNGALQLYRLMGYEVVHKHSVYRKEME
jgi:mycothiol synthase